MKCENVIMGFFWRKDYRNRRIPFIGNLKLKSDGTFKGETKDEFGKARISGEIGEKSLSFLKNYRPGSRGTTGAILYKFKSVDSLTGGGWQGTCVVVEPDNTETIWNTVCMIFPGEDEGILEVP